MTTSEQINELAQAMAKAQHDMKPAIKDATNPAYRSKYADIAAVWDACRGPLTAHGITVWQDAVLAENGVSVTTRLVHASGQWVEFGPLTVPLSKPDAHGVGSALSYGKRYALSAAIGIVAEDDDDGNAASGRNGRTAQAQALPVQEPRGYEDFVIQFSTVANQGLEPLRAAFKEAKPEYRDYLVKHDNVNYEAIKLRASKVKPKPEAVAS